MDPNRCYQELLKFARQVIQDCYTAEGPDPDHVLALAEHVVDLDEWIQRGGALPETWRQPKK